MRWNEVILGMFFDALEYQVLLILFKFSSTQLVMTYSVLLRGVDVLVVETCVYTLLGK